MLRAPIMKTIRSLALASVLVLGGLFATRSASGIPYYPLGTNALSFDGTNGSVALGLPDLPPPWTATMWVRRTAPVGPSSALLISPASALKLDQWPDSRQVGFTLFGVADYYFDYTAPQDQWVHLAFVATASNTTLYANGIAVDVIPASVALPLESLGSATRDPLKGEVDELAVWNVARSGAQIRSTYLLRGASQGAGLQLLWHMDETNGLTTADATTHHHDGTLSGGVTRVTSYIGIGAPKIVTNGNDSGPGSLREAVADFGNPGVIRFAPGLNGKTIKLTSGPISLARNVILDGSTLTRVPTISGNTNGRVFDVPPDRSVLLYKLKLVNGRVSGGFPDGYGGAIFNSGDLALSDCVLSNHNAFAGGAIYNQGDATLTLDRCAVSLNRAEFGGGVQNEGELLANDSIFLSNSASTEGGALSAPFNEAAFYRCSFTGNSAVQGGAIINGAALELTQCNFLSNRSFDAPANARAGDGGAIHNRASGELEVDVCLFSGNFTGRGGAGGSGQLAGWGGAIFTAGSASINHSTFTRNYTGQGGQGFARNNQGADGGDGGAIRNNGTLDVNNSTFNGNFTGDGGYAGDGGAISTDGGSAVITHTTISGNRTGKGFAGGNGGGIWAGGGSTLTLNSCVLAGNSAQNAQDILPLGAYVTDHTLTGTEALLAPLAFYGGPTATMLPLPGSPLIDAAGSTGFVIDQRLLPRPIGAGPDIGAVEVQENPVTTRPTIVVSPQGGSVPAGSTQTLRVGVTGTAPFTFQWQFNGRSIPGGTNAALVLNNVQRANGGSYKVRVSNAFGSATSGSARLKIVQPVIITAHPTNVAVAAGGSTTLRVSATGGTPLKYQWRFNGLDLPGATRSSYTISGMNAGKAGSYTVRVSNPVGFQVSNIAAVTLAP